MQQRSVACFFSGHINNTVPLPVYMELSKSQVQLENASTNSSSSLTPTPTPTVTGDTDEVLTMKAFQEMLPDASWWRQGIGLWVMLVHQGVIAVLALLIVFVDDLGFLCMLLGMFWGMYGIYLVKGKCYLNSLEMQLCNFDLADTLSRMFIPGYVKETHRDVLVVGKILTAIYFVTVKILGILAIRAWRGGAPLHCLIEALRNIDRAHC